MEEYPSVGDIAAIPRSMQATRKKRRPISLDIFSKSYHSFSNRLRRSRQSFEHEPLNHEEPSIRLIQVLPGQDGGKEPIKCLMTHTTVYDNYTCLSYVWGSSQNMESIQMNGYPFKIQQNLWNFLNVARKKYAGMPFWIDALCIQQNNDQERNHQVQQMGKIYSQAREVLAWLGDVSAKPETGESIATFFARIRNSRHASDGFSDLEIQMGGLSDFLRSDYWTRAWITQELLLSRQVTFLAGMEEVGLNRIAQGILCVDTGQAELSRIRPFIHVNGRGSRISGKSLFHLLYLFREKKCSLPRDRIFSLLSLCGEGSDLMVDYVERDDQLIPRILRACKKSSCFCSVALLMQTLNVSLESIRADPWDLVDSYDPLLQLSLGSTTLEKDICPTGCRLPHAWTATKPHVFHLHVNCCRTNYGHLCWDQGSNTLQYAPGGSRFSGMEHPKVQIVNSRFQIHPGPWKVTNDGTEYQSVTLSLNLDFRTVLELVQSELEAKEGVYDLCGKAWGYWDKDS